MFVNLLEFGRFFLYLVHGFVKTMCTGKGGGRVDADSDPLSIFLFWQEALFLGLVSAACPRLTPICLWHRKAKDAAFCW